MSVTLRPTRVNKSHHYFISGIILAASSYFLSKDPLLLFASGVIGLIPALKAELWRFGKKFVIKDDELIFEEGIIRKAKTNISMNNLISVSIKQGIRERLLNYGTVTLSSWSDKSTVPTELFKVRRPKEVAEHLNFLIKKNKEDRNDFITVNPKMKI